MPRRLALLLAFSLSLPACARSEAGGQVSAQGEERTRALQTVVVGARDMPHVVRVTGSLVADQQSDLAANASGRVLSTHVERGQKIAAGQVLVVLDARLANWTAKAAAAQTKVAKAQVELTGLECGRADKLLASGTISQAEYDRTLSQCASAQSAMTAAASQAALSSVQAKDAVVKAPFAGVVGERFVEVGEYVQPQARVVSLYAIDPIRVSIAIPEAEIGRIALEQRVRFAAHGLGAQQFDAVVKYVSPALREATRDLVVEAVAPNPDGTLRPGMFVTVEIAAGDERHAVVPEASLFERDGRTYVWAVRDQRAIEQLVRVGVRHDGMVAILAGVAEGDAIVAEPPADLVDGTKLE